MSPRVVLTYPHALGVPGGGTVHCHRLALGLAREGADLTLVPVESLTMSVFPRRRPRPEYRHGPFLEPLLDAGITVRPTRQSSLAWWFDGLAVRRELVALDADRELDAVLAWWGEVAFALPFLHHRGVFVGLLAAAPYSLWWERSGGRPRWLHRLADQWLLARTARRVDRVFANSLHTASQVVDILGVDRHRVDIVPPPLEERFTRIERPRTERVERLLYFGRLRQKKGVFDVVEALGQLTDRPWQLRIVGAGDVEGVDRAVRSHRIADRTEVLGPMDPGAIDEQLAWAQLAVLPSYEESFGLAVAEAQLAGLPVIAYHVGAIPEILRDGESGWLVPVGRIDELTKTIRRALTDPEAVDRSGRVARQHATSQLLADSSASRILRVIEEVGAERRRRTRAMPDRGAAETRPERHA